MGSTNEDGTCFPKTSGLDGPGGQPYECGSHDDWDVFDEVSPYASPMDEEDWVDDDDYDDEEEEEDELFPDDDEDDVDDDIDDDFD